MTSYPPVEMDLTLDRQSCDLYKINWIPVPNSKFLIAYWVDGVSTGPITSACQALSSVPGLIAENPNHVIGIVEQGDVPIEELHTLLIGMYMSRLDKWSPRATKASDWLAPLNKLQVNILNENPLMPQAQITGTLQLPS